MQTISVRNVTIIFGIHARHRIEMVADEGSFEEWNTDLETRNPLHYKGYEEKLNDAGKDRT